MYYIYLSGQVGNSLAYGAGNPGSSPGKGDIFNDADDHFNTVRGELKFNFECYKSCSHTLQFKFSDEK